MSDRCGFHGEQIMFSSNDTPAEEFELAAKLGATINLDDFTHIDFLEKTIGYIPETISCRYNPGGVFQLGESKEGFQVMDNPGDAKYGFTRDQLFEGFRVLKAKGAKRFGLHAFLASNKMCIRDRRRTASAPAAGDRQRPARRAPQSAASAGPDGPGGWT